MLSRKLTAFIAMSVLSAVTGVSAAGYTVHADRYTDRFIEGTIINGIDAGDMTAAEVEAVIRDRVEEYGLRVIFPAGSTEDLTSEEIGFSYASDNGVEKILKSQDKYDWIRGKFGETTAHQVGEKSAFNEETLKETVWALPEMQPENQIRPANAYMAMGEDHRLMIVPEVDGTVVDTEKVYNALVEAVRAGETEVDLSPLDIYSHAEINSEDPALNLQVNDLNSYLDMSITYQMYDGSEVVLDGETMYKWLSTKPEDPDYYYLDTNVFQEKCSQFVHDLAVKYDRTYDSISFHSTCEGDITFPVATYGHQVDLETEPLNLYQDILSRKSVKREPAYYMNSMMDGSFGGTYVEVDKNTQHVWYYSGGELVWESDCVTGRESEGRRTPTCVYYIYLKQRNRVLKGRPDENGNPSYESFVNFWMPFNGGIGLHDATWRSDFGGDIYYYSGSHGCVNLPYSKAESLYEMVETGTPVIVI